MKDLEGSTVLIVDDSEVTIDILVETLGDLFNVLVAMDGESALAMAEEEGPDLVLLDILMPGMDGYEVCRRLKAREATANTPVIFVTSKTDEADEAFGFALGAVDYITKPISPAIVRARVNTHLKLQRANHELRTQNCQLKELANLREEVERITRHDLKNPLQLILGLPELMLVDGNFQGRDRENLESIRRAGLRMLNMINSSLDLFAMERGSYRLDPRETDLLQTVRRLIAETEKAEARAKGRIKLSAESFLPLGPERFSVWGEELLLYSMVSNLLTNALDASPKDEEIRVGLKESDSVYLSIHNKGAVPRQIRPIFFNKYVTAGKPRGTGLGTYSAKLIAQAHGGDISLDTSHEGETTVTVRLKRMAA